MHALARCFIYYCIKILDRDSETYKVVIIHEMNVSVLYIYASLLKQIVTSLTTVAIGNVKNRINNRYKRQNNAVIDKSKPNCYV